MIDKTSLYYEDREGRLWHRTSGNLYVNLWDSLLATWDDMDAEYGPVTPTSLQKWAPPEPHPETVIYDREGATWIRLENGWAPTINPHHQIPWEDLYEQSPLMSETQWARFTARLRAAVPNTV